MISPATDAKEPRDHVGAQDDRGVVESGVSRRLGVGSNHVNIGAEPGPRQHEADGKRDHDEEDEGQGKEMQKLGVANL